MNSLNSNPLHVPIGETKKKLCYQSDLNCDETKLKKKKTKNMRQLIKAVINHISFCFQWNLSKQRLLIHTRSYRGIMMTAIWLTVTIKSINPCLSLIIIRMTNTIPLVFFCFSLTLCLKKAGRHFVFLSWNILFAHLLCVLWLTAQFWILCAYEFDTGVKNSSFFHSFKIAACIFYL